MKIKENDSSFQISRVGWLIEWLIDQWLTIKNIILFFSYFKEIKMKTDAEFELIWTENEL